MKQKYTYEIHDGDEWIEVLGVEFDTPEAAKKAGVDAGFEYVRVKALDANAPEAKENRP